MRDLRTMNFTAGQKIESDEVMKRLGTLLSRNLGVLSKINIFDTGKALIIGNGFRVEPSSGMTISVPSGVCLQRTVDVLPVLQGSSQLITLDAASGSPRIDTIEAQVKTIIDKADVVQVGEVASGTSSVSISNQSIMRDIKHYLAVQKKTGTTSATAATQGILTGTVSIPTTIDLSSKYLINLRDGEDGSYQEIDCRGATPNATTRAEIIAAINAAVGRTMASTGAGNVIVLTGNGYGLESTFTLKPVVTDSSKDAIFVIFGISAGGVYKYEYTGVNEWFKIAEIDVGAASVSITSGMIRNIDQKSTWASESSDVDVRKYIYKEIDDLNTIINETKIKTWATATDYITGDYIFNSGMLYVVISNHTSGIFYDDLISGKLDIINENVIPKADDGSLNETTWLKIKNEILKSVKAGSIFSNPIISTYSLAHTTSTAYSGGVLAPNGDIHFVPLTAIRGQKVDSSGIVSTYALAYTVASAYRGGVLAPDGSVHFIPYGAARGQKIDSYGIASTYALAYTAAIAYRGGVIDANGNIHFVPSSAVVGQKISMAGVASTYALVYTTTTAYSGGVLAPNGDIHFIPFNSGIGQKVDSSGVVSTYALAYTTATAYSGGVLAPNGDIHFVPLNSGIGQKIDSSGVVSTYALAYTVTTAYSGGVLAPNGDIHFVPSSAAVGQKINIFGVVSTYPLLYTGTTLYEGGVLAPNGEIHFIPYGAARGEKILNRSFVPFSHALCMHPFFNKL